jgi:hypothetical protein
MEAAMASHAAAMAAENGTAVHETTGPAESAEAI